MGKAQAPNKPCPSLSQGHESRQDGAGPPALLRNEEPTAGHRTQQVRVCLPRHREGWEEEGR